MTTTREHGAVATTNEGGDAPSSVAAPPPRRPGGRIFFGWYIVAAGFLLTAVLGGLMFHAFGQYVVVFENEFGWSRTSLSIAFSIQMVEAGLLGPAQGWALDKFGPRRIMLVGIIIFGVGFLLLSQISTLTGFYIAFIVIALGMSMGPFLGVIVAVVNWFNRRRAMAVAITTSGFAVGGFLQPGIAWSLEHLGWRETAIASGLIVIAVGLPLAGLMRHRPGQYGYRADGDPPRPGPGGQRPDGRLRPRRDQLHLAGGAADARVLDDLNRSCSLAAGDRRSDGALRLARDRQPRLLAGPGGEPAARDHGDERGRHARRRLPRRPLPDAPHPRCGDGRAHGVAARADAVGLGLGRRPPSR